MRYVFLLALLITASKLSYAYNDVTSLSKDWQQMQRGRPGILKHRHSFDFDVTQVQDPTTAFLILDSDELFGVSTTSLPLTQFSLSVYNDKHGNHQTGNVDASDFQQTLRLERGSKLLPNTSDKETVVNLAKMTSNAYLFDPTEPDWLNNSLGFNFSSGFGQESNGLRGHVFTTEDDSFVVVTFKGTSIDPRANSTGSDRLNDNKLFGCCCGAQNPYRYAAVCNCSTGYYQCDSNCLTQTVLQKDSYYDAAVVVMSKIRRMYPNSALWVAGHSLGGSLASLVGLTFNIPSVSFEAPPERLPAQRLGLLPPNITTSPDDRTMAYHFGNTADPVYMGACNGYFSSCSFWGFSFDSQCHSGRRCVYDTVRDKGWRVSINNHRINYVIENVLKAYDEVPICEEDPECGDCFNWKFS